MCGLMYVLSVNLSYGEFYLRHEFLEGFNLITFSAGKRFFP